MSCPQAGSDSLRKELLWCEAPVATNNEERRAARAEAGSQCSQKATLGHVRHVGGGLKVRV